jgi:hypothetical protein
MIDFTQICIAVITGVFTLATILIPLWLNSKMNDKQAAIVIGNAVKNSLGEMQQATEAMIQSAKIHATIPGVTPTLAVGIQYVLDHAGDEMKRFNITPEAIADKITAQVGLANIATNQAVAANSLPIVPGPLDAVPVVKS